MKTLFVESNNIVSLSGAFTLLNSDENTFSVLMFMACENHFSNETLKEVFPLLSKPIIGGVFPELIHEGVRKSSGTLLIALPFKLKSALIDLESSSEEIANQLAAFHPEPFVTESSLFVFTDAFSSFKDFFIESLFNFFGTNISYLGGGAGSLSFKQFPCIITNTGLHANCAVIGLSEHKIAIGAAHGWKPISEPLKVTKSVINQLITIDWRPAFEVYKEIVEAHSGEKFNDSNFFDIAKSYPLGITKVDAEMVVRDPYMVANSTIHLVDIITQGEYINILHGNMKLLLEGATIARNLALSKLKNRSEDTEMFCIDCISRVLYMQDDFDRELQAISSKGKVNGILSIGEIANSGESYLEIYNKTVVIGVW